MSTECNKWQGYVNKGNGYGQRTVDSVSWYAHRYAYFQVYGPIPAGKCVLHKCDEPLCVNPEHLFLGTQLDNIKDMAQKGRGTHRVRRVIPDDVVRAIRAEPANISQRVLAKKYGIVQSGISEIRSGARRRDVK